MISHYSYLNLERKTKAQNECHKHNLNMLFKRIARKAMNYN